MLRTAGEPTLTFQRMDSLLLGSFVNTAEIVPKVWVSTSSKEDLHHTERNQKERNVKSRKGPGNRDPDSEACLGIGFVMSDTMERT